MGFIGMGRYLDLARQALADLNDGSTNPPTALESPQSDNQLGYERYERHEIRVSPTPGTDSVEAAARAEVERLGALTPADYWARQAAALLATVADQDRRVDLRELFEHRAAVCEFDGGLSRTDAERIAFAELQARAGGGEGT